MKDYVAIQTDPLLGLSFLSTSDVIPPDHQIVFEMAKAFAQRLKDLKDHGVWIVEPQGILYYAFISWFTPVLRLFDADADYRQVTRATWPQYVFVGKSLDPDSKILLSFGWGHGLDPLAGGSEPSGKADLGDGEKSNDPGSQRGSESAGKENFDNRKKSKGTGKRGGSEKGIGKLGAGFNTNLRGAFS